MATTRCWLKSEIKAMFKEIGGKGKIADIAKMSSAEREALFAKYSDADAAKDFNLEFEKMLVIPKQQEVLKRWMEKTGKTESEYVAQRRGKRLERFAEKSTEADTTGVAIRQPPMTDLVSRINKMEQVLNPTKDIAFLESLAKQRLGFEITQADSATLFFAASAVNNARRAMNDELQKTEKGRNYLDPTKKVSFDELTKKQREAILAHAKSEVEFQTVYDEMALKTRTETWYGNVAGFIKSLKASFDLSATFNQLGVLLQPLIIKAGAIKLGLYTGKLQEPTNTQKMQIQMRNNIFNYKKLATTDPSAVLEELYSRPNYLNGNYAKAGLDIGVREEAYPSAVMDKLEAGEGKTILGRFLGKILAKIGSPFTRSENAYNLAIQVARADYFDLQYMLNNGDKKIFDKDNIKKVGDFVNQVTGRGKLSIDPKLNKKLGANFFSPRYLTARIQTAYNVLAGAKNFGEKLVDVAWNNIMADTKFGDKIANLFGKEHFKELSLSERTAVEKMRYSAAWQFMATAWTVSFLINLVGHGLLGDDPDWWRDFIDPTSTDFGKIRVGTVHWDLSNGINSLFVMLVRGLLATRKTQAGTYEKTDWGELIWNFVQPKTAPAVQTILDTQKALNAWRKGKETPESYGSKIFGAHWILEQFVPMALMNAGDTIVDSVKDKSWGTFALEGAATVGDFFGIPSSTYTDRAYNGYDNIQRTYLRSLVSATGENPPKMDLDKNSSIMTKFEGEERDKKVAEFQERWGQKLNETINSAQFLQLPPKEQMKRLKKLRSNIAKEIAQGKSKKK